MTKVKALSKVTFLLAPILVFEFAGKLLADSYVPAPNGLYQSTTLMPPADSPNTAFAQPGYPHARPGPTGFQQTDVKSPQGSAIESVEIDGKVYRFPVDRRRVEPQNSRQPQMLNPPPQAYYQPLYPSSQGFYQPPTAQQRPETQIEIDRAELNKAPEQLVLPVPGDQAPYPIAGAYPLPQNEAFIQSPSMQFQSLPSQPMPSQPMPPQFFPWQSQSKQFTPPQGYFRPPAPQNFQSPWSAGQDPYNQLGQFGQYGLGLPPMNRYSIPPQNNVYGAPNPWSILQAYPSGPNW